MKLILGMILSYVLGAIPSAYIAGKIYKKIDIRLHGSGNVGATNVFRVLGKGPGILVLSADILKGLLAVTILADLLGLEEVVYRLILAVCAVSGHNWTIFLKFKGGKGIATSLGVLIGLTLKIAAIRPVLLGTVLTWVVCFLIFGYVSLASIFAAVVLPILAVITAQSMELIVLAVVFCLFVVLRHRPNIRRLFAGQEPRVPIFSKKKYQ